MLVIWQVVILNVFVSVWAWLSCGGAEALGYMHAAPLELVLTERKLVLRTWGVEPRAECCRAVVSVPVLLHASGEWGVPVVLHASGDWGVPSAGCVWTSGPSAPVLCHVLDLVL